MTWADRHPSTGKLWPNFSQEQLAALYAFWCPGETNMPKTMDDLVAKGWTNVEVAAGQSVDVAYNPETQNINVRRQAYDAAGEQIKGKDKPKVTVDHHDSGSTISTDAAEAVTVLYRVVDEDDTAEPLPVAP